MVLAEPGKLATCEPTEQLVKIYTAFEGIRT